MVPVPRSFTRRLNRLSAASPGSASASSTRARRPLAPLTDARSDEGESDGKSEGGRRGAGGYPANQRVTSAVEEVVLHRIAKRTIEPEPP